MATNLNILNLVNGDMLHANDGLLIDGRLSYNVGIAAPANAIIEVNGIKAVYSDGAFSSTIVLEEYRNNINVTNTVSSESCSITVYRLTNFAGHYRLSIDDNIWFLQDLHVNEHRYTSIFDNPYLGSLKKIHDNYGTRIHINLFYQTEGFNLSQLSDKFRAEWTAQADWIRLSFHALQEKPDMPYKYADYDTVKKDCDLVMNEIRRFAGEALMGPVTTLHWAEATSAGCSALRDAGYKGQLGYFNIDDNEPTASYYLTEDQRRHIKKRIIWRDPEQEIIFVKTSIVLDRTKLNDIVPWLDRYGQLSRKPAYADFLIHEQYFYPFYEAYQPDYFNRIEAAVQWAVKNNYTPAFLGDCIFQ